MKKFFLKNKNGAFHKRGFTLVEMLVSIFIFSIVMTIATGAMFSIVTANKTSQSLKSVMDNLNSALENMTRNMRYGSDYHCGTSGRISDPQSCAQGDIFFSFESKDGDPTKDNDQVIYEYDATSASLIRCFGYDNTTCARVTAPEVHIDSLKFYVTGASTGSDGLQPLVLITIKGYAGLGSNKSEFSIETMASQRNRDK
jgi:prepilin-type N-terminal cleavage/methylation domain-containing protein